MFKDFKMLLSKEMLEQPVDVSCRKRSSSAVFSPHGALPAETVYRLFTPDIFKAKHLLVTPQWFIPPKRGKTHLSFPLLFKHDQLLIHY